ncbi:DNA polymerase [Streptomyces avermitilis]|uniref:DNA polymerase n=1 Tax=Streptomyces avermitilis TaxID=33903 RepID=UPI0037F7D06E
MREFSGALGGLHWTGWLVERPADLAPFLEWVRRQRDTVCFDTETLGLGIYHQARKMGRSFVRLAQFGTATEAWAIPVELGPAFHAAAQTALRELPALTGHNMISFDGLASDKHLGVSLEEICAKSTDTMITSKLLDPRPEEAGGLGAKLKPQAAFFIDPSAPDTQDGLTKHFNSLGFTKETGWAGIDLFDPLYVEYALLDVILGSRLLPVHLAELDRLGVRRALIDYEHEISRICATMSRAGMFVDSEYTHGLYDTLDAEYQRNFEIVQDYGITKLGSPAQVAEALLNMGEELTERTDAGNVKVDKSVLLHLCDRNEKWERIGGRTPNPLAEAVYHAKRASKWRTAYVDTFLEEVDEHGYVHANVNTLQARTGRMSVTKPAVQTLPSRDMMIRRCLMADPGELVISVDFSAIEMRVLAALADVKRMKQAFAAGEDIHWFTARLVAGEDATEYDRKQYKTVGLGKVYGGGIATLARQSGASEEAVQRAASAYNRLYPEIARSSKRWTREAYQNGMVHVSATGRRLPLDRDRTYAVVNYACQSAARDVLGQSLIDMDAAGLLPYLRLPIHDEVLAFAPKAEADEVAREIERCMTFDLFGVPITAEGEIGKRSWGSLYGADV